jgi:hypothetical protein
MPQLKLLHLSDLHIRAGQDSPFSADRIENTLDTIQSIGEIDLLAISGDFVHAAAREKIDDSWADAERALTALTERFRAKEKLILCPGNHDINRSDAFPSGAVLAEGRGLERYKAFSERLRPDVRSRKQYLPIGDIGVGYQIETREGLVAVIELHMTFNMRCVKIDDQREYVPGVLGSEDYEQLCAAVDRLWESGLLVIVGHYPIGVYSFSQSKEEAKSARKSGLGVSLWGLRHLADGWGDLLDYVATRTRSGGRQVLLLHGDTHSRVGVRKVRHGVFSSLIGRADAVVDSLRPGSFRYLNLNLSSLEGSAYVDYVFEVDTHVAQHTTTGSWFDFSDLVSCSESPESVGALHVASKIDPELMFPDADDTRFDLSEELKNTIRRAHLLELRRVGHRDSILERRNFVRLGHIRIGPILGQSLNVRSVVEHFATWLRMEHGSRLSDAVLVGIDAWGGALASLLGLHLGCKSTSVTLRGSPSVFGAPDNTAHDNVDGKMGFHTMEVRGFDVWSRQVVQEAKFHVLVTDFVVTGETLERARKMIVGVTDRDVECVALCVFAAVVPSMFGPPVFPLRIAAIVNDIRIPLVPQGWLPSLDLLPVSGIGGR